MPEGADNSESNPENPEGPDHECDERGRGAPGQVQRQPHCQCGRTDHGDAPGREGQLAVEIPVDERLEDVLAQEEPTAANAA